MCVSVDNLGRKCENLGRCKSIQSLNLEYKTGVTKIGLQIALENMPVLKILDHDATFEVLVEIAQISLSQTLPGPPKFPLVVLRMPCTIRWSTPYKSGDFRLVSTLCPSVTILRIEETDGFSDIDLVSLMTLNSLRDLEIYAESSIERKQHIKSKITFEGGVAPLLKTIGSQLKKLELCNLSSVNIQTIMEFCPNLVSLRLVDNISYNNTICLEVQKSVISKQSKETPIFQKLKTLRIEILQLRHLISTRRHLHDHYIPREMLVCLLSSPLLREIVILDCDMLTDCVLFAVGKHHFKKLEKLCLQNCDFVTKKGIDFLMQDGNPLKEIDLTDCMQVSSAENRQYWIDKAKKNNWELSI